jgi:predicted dehydrogenase
MNQKTGRRSFLKASAAVGLFNIVPSYVLGGQNHTPPCEQLTKGIIGVGGMGKGHRGYEDTRLLAVCDVDRNHRDQAANWQGTVVDKYADFRELLARPDIDIVHIATPPHWHGLISIMAAEAGKDIWCEKPMTRTIAEGLGVIDAVERHGRIFRINTWFRFGRNSKGFYGSGISVQDAKKVVASGMLGWPLTFNVGRHTGFNWKMNWSGRTDLVPEKIPEALDYNMWLGPAPYRPYSRHRTHSTFRGYWDYDGGGLGDMGQHYLDPVQYIMGKDNTSPVNIVSESIQQHYDAVGNWKRVEMTYADGCKIVLDGAGTDSGAPFISGPKGNLWRNMRSDIHNFEKKVASLPNPPRQEDNFSKCVRERRKFGLNEHNAHRSANLINLAKISIRLGRELNFDPDKQIFIDDEGANRLRDQPMRTPWMI